TMALSHREKQRRRHHPRARCLAHTGRKAATIPGPPPYCCPATGQVSVTVRPGGRSNHPTEWHLDGAVQIFVTTPQTLEERTSWKGRNYRRRVLLQFDFRTLTRWSRHREQNVPHWL